MSNHVAIIELEDDAQIASVLAPERRWAAYALCDLEPPHRPYARYVGAVHDGGHVTAMVLLYAPPTFTSLLPCGEPEDVAAILAQTTDLPVAPLVLVQQANRQAVETRYRLTRVWTMLRMAVTADELQSPARVRAEIVPLSNSDLPLLQRFYMAWPDTVFAPSMLEQGVYFGAYRRGELLAVAACPGRLRRLPRRP